MEQCEYQPGDTILTESEPSEFALRIVSGEVEVFVEREGEKVVLGTVKPGEFLGEMGIIEGRPRSASARAKTNVQATRLERWEFLRLMSQDSSSAYRLITRLSERLRAANSQLAEVLTSRTVPQPSPVRGDGQGVPPRFRLTLVPASKELRAHLPNEGIVLTNLPFSVGRSLRPNEPQPETSLDLSLPDSPPFRLSRQHFSLCREADGVAVHDLGSTLGTEVNEECLGQHFGVDSTLLRVGENKITAGGVGSPFAFTVLLQQT